MGTGRYNSKHTSNLPNGVRDITQAVADKKIQYRTFESTPIGGYSYGDDGHATQDFFHDTSNADQLIRGMSPMEIMAFDYWTRGTFMGLNTREFKYLSSLEQSMIRIYDKYLDKAELYEGITVRRLASFSLINNGSRSIPTDFDALKNQPIELTAPLSAAAAKEGLTIGQSSKNVEYIFHIPPSKGSGMWLGNTRINNWGDRQREFMLNRNTIYTTGDIRYNSKRGVYEVDMWYVGRTKHTYK